MATVVKPPSPLDSTGRPSVFLAGSIEMGSAVDWQARMEDRLRDLDVVIYNPRREEWDQTWRQSIDNPQFRQQVEWELDAQEVADVIAFYFAPDTKAPVSLLELGLALRTGKAVVCCPEGYWRKGNIDVTVTRFQAVTVYDLDGLAIAVRARLHQR